MATYINGFGGDIQFASTPVTLNVAKWTVNATANTSDTTNTGDGGWESHVLGSKSWTAEVEAYWDSSAVPTATGKFVPGDYATLTLKAGSTAKVYTGTAALTNAVIVNDPKERITFNVSFKGTGALTYAS